MKWPIILQSNEGDEQRAPCLQGYKTDGDTHTYTWHTKERLTHIYIYISMDFLKVITIVTLIKSSSDNCKEAYGHWCSAEPVFVSHAILLFVVLYIDLSVKSDIAIIFIIWGFLLASSALRIPIWPTNPIHATWFDKVWFEVDIWTTVISKTSSLDSSYRVL